MREGRVPESRVEKELLRPTLDPPVYYWEVLSQVQNQGVRAVLQAGTRLLLRTLSGESGSGHPSTLSRVSHSNPSWPLHTLERWRQPRGRKWPAAGPGLAVPKQGSPGHTRPPAEIAHPSPARARCAPLQSPPDAVPALGSPHTRRSPGRGFSIPRGHSPGGTPGAQPPAQSLDLPATGGGLRGPSCSSRLEPRQSGSAGLALPRCYFCFGGGRAT